jgi:hypothetical protein
MSSASTGGLDRARPRRTPQILAAALLTGCVLAGPRVALATSWTPLVNPGSRGQAQAQALPAAPTGVGAACTSPTGKTIRVTWAAVTRATSYSIYKSTTSATTGYTLAASGVTTTTWTSGTLANATYWFEVTAYTGTNWISANSAASPSHKIATTGCT